MAWHWKTLLHENRRLLSYVNTIKRSCVHIYMVHRPGMFWIRWINSGSSELFRKGNYYTLCLTNMLSYFSSFRPLNISLSTFIKNNKLKYIFDKKEMADWASQVAVRSRERWQTTQDLSSAFERKCFINWFGEKFSWGQQHLGFSAF